MKNVNWHRKFAWWPKAFGHAHKTFIVWLRFYQRRWSAEQGCWLYRRDRFPI